MPRGSLGVFGVSLECLWPPLQLLLQIVSQSDALERFIVAVLRTVRLQVRCDTYGLLTITDYCSPKAECGIGRSGIVAKPRFGPRANLLAKSL